MEAWQATVQDEFGNAVFNPQITVYETDGVTLASIYNEDGSPKANPFTGSLEGFAQFWAGPGVYKIRGANGGQTEIWDLSFDPMVLPDYAAALVAAGRTSANTISAIVGGKLIEWVRDPAGTCLGGGWAPAGITATLHHWGVVPGLTTDQGAGIALAFASGRVLVDDGGDYRIVGRTIVVPIPTMFYGAKGKTRFIFTGMGGFNGLDGFDFAMPLGSPVGTTAGMVGCQVLVDGNYGRDGIKTACNPDGQGMTIFRTIRPRYIFRDMLVGSLNRTATSTSSQFGQWGWQNCIRIGESADSEVTGVRFQQPFLASIAQADWAGRDDCAGVYFDAGEVDNGAGPIYLPQFSHNSAHGCGRVVRTRGHVTVLKMSNNDGVGNGWGLYASSDIFSPLTGTLDGLSEPVITNNNINTCFGGLFIQSTDSLHTDGNRFSLTSFGGPVIDWSGEWVAIKVAAGFRHVSINGLRASVFSPADQAPNMTFREIDLNGQYNAVGYAPAVVSITDHYIRNAGSTLAWVELIALRNVREATIEAPKVSGGPLSALFYHTDTTGSAIRPKITVPGGLTYAIQNLVNRGPGSERGDFFLGEVTKGVRVFPAASAAGSQTILPTGPAHTRQGFQAGTEPYNYDYTFSDQGAFVGQKVEVYFQLPATNATVRFFDSAGFVIGSAVPTGEVSNWYAVIIWMETGGNLRARPQFIGRWTV